MIKIYETINDIRLVTSIDHKGSYTSISFNGGCTVPRRRNGVFRTDDHELQESLEKSSSYNKDYRLRMEFNAPEPQKELIVIDSVTNKQMAIEWMRINLDITIDNLTASEVIVGIATENGYYFSRWNPIKNNKYDKRRNKK